MAAGADTALHRAAPHPARGDHRLRAAWEMVNRPDVRVISTDVFDTLVWRQVAAPHRVFSLLADRLRSRGHLAARMTSESFLQLRRLAEREARLNRAHSFGDLEVNLEEVYAVLPSWVFNHPEGRDIALDTEVSLERDLIVADLDVVELLTAAQAAGKLVIAVSDTYFSEVRLRDLLGQAGLGSLTLDRVFVSCEYRQGKNAGLFEAALGELGLAPAAMVHLGDNEDADIAPARALGIEAVAFERLPLDLAKLIEDEKRFCGPSTLTGGFRAFPPELGSLRGKVAVRAEGRSLPLSLQPFWQAGALVYGPVLSGFAEWVQERGGELGAHSLHCFMREGEFLAPLIDRAGEYLGLAPRAQRLWLNREVLAAASLGDASGSELGALLTRRRAPTVQQLLHTVGLSLADLPRYASHANTSLDDPVVRNNLFDAIEDDAVIQSRILEYARTQRERIVRYVEQLLDGQDRLFVVDLGWAGGAQAMLNNVLRLAGRPLDIVGLYLVTHAGATRNVFMDMKTFGYLGEFGEPELAVNTIVRSPEILEQTCMPPHGSQTGLDETLQPVLAPSPHHPLQAAEASAVRQGVLAFQREWARYQVVCPGKLPSLAWSPEVLRPLLVRQLAAPTEIEATLLGGWAHDENQGSDRTEQIADLSLAGRLRHLAPDQLRRVSMSDLYWPAGLAARVDPPAAELFAAASAGELDWDALSAELETGPFVVEVARGVDVDAKARLADTPRRNRHGLSAVSGSIGAPAIQELVLRPARHPCVLRLDFLEARCYVQGQNEPLTISLDAPEQFSRLRRENCFVLNPNVFVVHGAAPALYLDLESVVAGTVFRVDVQVGFAIMAISQLLPTPGRLRSVEDAGIAVERAEAMVERAEAMMAQMRSSVSWRMTAPLRRVKRMLR